MAYSQAPSYGQPMQGYPPQGQGPGPVGQPPQQSYAQYGNAAGYPTGYNPYYGTQPKRRDSSAFLNAVRQLPAMLRGSFQDPGAVLQNMMERRDLYTTPVVAGVVLLLTFLCGMVFSSALVRGLFGLVSLVTGRPMADDATSLTQGVNFVASKISVSIGGIAALCQLFAMLMPLAVLMVYLCAVCKLRFSWEMLFGCFTITALPTAGIALLGMLVALLYAPLVLLLAMIGAVIGYVFIGSLMGRVTGKPEQALVLPKIICISVSILLTLVFFLLVGGTLLGGVMTTTAGMLLNLGSLM